MASFTKGPSYRTPFGTPSFLRSTQDVKTESYTLAKDSVPFETIDGTVQKMIHKGEILARITSGPDTGKVGPYQSTAGTAEVQTLTKTGTWSAGTYTLTVLGATTTDLAYNATAATIQAAIRAALLATDDETLAEEAANLTATGGPLSTTPVVVTFATAQGANVAAITWDISLVTGTTPGLGVAETTPGVAGATDGRQTAANIVGICNTELPWQLLDRDVEVAAVYECTAVQANCTERDAAGARITLTNTTADNCRGTRGLDILFK